MSGLNPHQVLIKTGSWLSLPTNAPAGNDAKNLTRATVE